MRFQIFIPDANPPSDKPAQSPDLLVAAGLADLAQGFDCVREHEVDGRPGRMYAWCSPQQPHVLPGERFRWLPAVAWEELPAGRYYAGIPHDGRPRPTELARDWQFPGRAIELGDGNLWRIPEPERIPRQVQIADDGSLQYQRLRDFHGYTIDAEFVRQVDDWRDRFRAGMRECDHGEALAFALRALRLNYRLTPEVANALGLFTTENLHLPILVALGGYLARELETEQQG